MLSNEIIANLNLHSPRSLEACRRQGIDPTELIIKNIEQIKELYKDRKFDREGFEMMARSFEDRRKEKIKILLEVNICSVIILKIVVV